MTIHQDLIDALKSYETAFDELFGQCASNPIKNAWGRDVSLGALNDAHVLAHSALGKLASLTPRDAEGEDASLAMAQAIHYPACWDTAVYPTLASALHEMAAWFKCSNDEHLAPLSAGEFAHQAGCALGGGLPDWPEDLASFEERKAYQRGVADERHRAALAEPQKTVSSAEDVAQALRPMSASIEAAALGLRGDLGDVVDAIKDRHPNLQSAADPAGEAAPMTEWVSAAERVPLESDGEVFVRFADGSIGTAWATYWHGASSDFAHWTHPDPDEDRAISHWMKPPGITAQVKGAA